MKIKLNDFLRKCLMIGGAVAGTFIIAVIILVGFIMTSLSGPAVSVFLILSVLLIAVSILTVFFTEEK